MAVCSGPARFDGAMYEQQLAYALAASAREAQEPSPPPAEEDELNRAIQASLRVGWQADCVLKCLGLALSIALLLFAPHQSVGARAGCCNANTHAWRTFNAGLGVQDQRPPKAEPGAPAAAAAAEDDPELRAAIEASLREEQRWAGRLL